MWSKHDPAPVVAGEMLTGGPTVDNEPDKDRDGGGDRVTLSKDELRELLDEDRRSQPVVVNVDSSATAGAGAASKSKSESSGCLSLIGGTVVVLAVLFVILMMLV